MIAPVALLTRDGAGDLAAQAPAFGPCEACPDRYLCGPYPCPRFGPEDIDEAAIEAAKEEA